MHDSAVASVSPRSRSSSQHELGRRRLLAARRDTAPHRRDELPPRSSSARASAPAVDEEVDVHLEVPRADRHVDPVPVAACGGERLVRRPTRRRRRSGAPAARARRPRRAGAAGAPSRARAARAAAARAAGPAARRRRTLRLEDDRRRRADQADPARAVGQRRLLDDAVARSRRTGGSSRAAIRRESSSIASRVGSSTCSPTPAARASSSIVRSSCVGPRPPETHEQVVGEPLAQRCLEVGRVVADDRDARRVEAEPEQRRGEIRAVAVGRSPRTSSEPDATIAARRATRGRQPVAVTMITRGCRPGTCTTLAANSDPQVLGRVDLHPELLAADGERPVALLQRAVVLDVPVAEPARAVRCVEPRRGVDRAERRTTFGALTVVR